MSLTPTADCLIPGRIGASRPDACWSTTWRFAASTFREMWQSFRLAKSTLDLTDSEMAQILAAKTPAEHDYDYEEDHETAPAPGMRP